MGSYTPLTWAQPDLAEVVIDTVVQPTLDEMARRGAPFVGCLYVGLALTAAGPRVIEFNCRFGDPDIQPVLARARVAARRAAARGGRGPARPTCRRRRFRDARRR